MTKNLIICVLLMASIGVQAKEVKNKRKTASAHQCTADALKRAAKLFKLHVPGGQMIVDDQSVEISEVNTIGGKGYYDAIRVQVLDGNSPYRTQFLYQQGLNSCQLMGQEILDLKNPY